MKKIHDIEREKYNLVHKASGFEPSQLGYARQINWLLNSNEEFCKKYRNLLSESESVLEIGVGSAENLIYLNKIGKKVVGIDISDFAIEEIKKKFGFEAFFMNAAKMDFIDNSFYLVQHLDGMEHIPSEWENDCLKEAIRVSSKYVIYANACGDAYWDHLTNSNGLGPVHINIKTPNQWSEFYSQNSIDLGYNIIYEELCIEKYLCILEKK